MLQSLDFDKYRTAKPNNDKGLVSEMKPDDYYPRCVCSSELSKLIRQQFKTIRRENCISHFELQITRYLLDRLAKYGCVALVAMKPN